MVKTFYETGDFKAKYAAEKWLDNNKYSYGSMQMDKPIGILKGEIYISKWRGMTDIEKGQLHGLMTSNDFRIGPVLIEIKDMYFKENSER